MNLELFTLHWLAGLFEGEASFLPGTPSRPHDAYITVAMTDEDVIARIAQLFAHSYTPIKPKVKHWQVTYRFTLRGRPAVELMHHLYPLMGSRRQQQIERALANFVYNPHYVITTPKITEAQVREIKRRALTGETARSIAQDYPISLYAVRDIRTGKTWSHISIDDSAEDVAPASKMPLPAGGPLQIDEEFTLHWFAGLLEGEGSFMAGAPSAPNAPRISIAMTDEDVIARAAGICGVKPQALRSRNENHKNVYRVHVKGRPAVQLMRQVYPWMGQRRQQQIDKALKSYVEIPVRRGMYNPLGTQLSEKQAREIKQRLADGETIASLAAAFNVSLSIIRGIKYGRTWKHIKI